MRRLSSLLLAGAATLALFLSFSSPAALAAPPDHGAWIAVGSVCRFKNSAMYDPVRNRMIVFGGTTGGGGDRGELNDVWKLSLAAPLTWQRIFPAGAAPPVRQSHFAVYDAARDRMVVFGGVDTDDDFARRIDYNDVWVLSLGDRPTWTQLAPVGDIPPDGPGATSDLLGVYDPVRDAIHFVYAGACRQIWTLELGVDPPRWTERLCEGSLDGPAYFHTGIYDPLRDRVLAFGGGSGFFSDAQNWTWELTLDDPPTWTQLATVGAPPPGRLDASAAYDAARDRLLVFGGAGPDLPSYDQMNDTWALSLADLQWTQLVPLAEVPSVRTEASAIYDPVDDRLVIFSGVGDFGYGGVSARATCTETWFLTLEDPVAWAQSFEVGRLKLAALGDLPRDRLVGIGGLIGGTLVGGVVGVDLGDGGVTDLGSTDGGPGNLAGASATSDPISDSAVIFGGIGGTGPSNALWRLSLAGTPAWTALSASGTPPPPRFDHTAVLDTRRTQMIVFGGTDGSTPLNDTWFLAFGGAPAWMPLSGTFGAPSPRSAHAAIYDPLGDRMVIFGGQSGPSASNDTWVLGLGTGPPGWTPLATSTLAPAPRHSASAIYDPVRSRMVVFGGANGTVLFNDAWALDLAGTGGPIPGGPAGAREAALATWTPLAPDGPLPPPRAGHVATYDPPRQRMAVFGGGDGSDALGDLWALSWDLATGTRVALVSAETEAGIVKLAWHVADGAGVVARIERRTRAGDWLPRAERMADGLGRIEYEDASVAPGEEFGYRLGLTEREGDVFGGEVWVTVPRERLTIQAIAPNPAAGAATLMLSLPRADALRIEVADLAGRRVLERHLPAPGSGTRSIRLDEVGTLAPGLYWIKVEQGAHAARARFCVVR